LVQEEIGSLKLHENTSIVNLACPKPRLVLEQAFGENRVTRTFAYHTLFSREKTVSKPRFWDCFNYYSLGEFCQEKFCTAAAPVWNFFRISGGESRNRSWGIRPVPASFDGALFSRRPGSALETNLVLS
jgi:hypothetical protein